MAGHENNKTPDTAGAEFLGNPNPGEFANRLSNARRLVECLERPGEDLDQAMQAYAQAMEELNWCREYLANARLKVEQWVAKS
jgi:exodeoxyribonuclease VII small subunit